MGKRNELYARAREIAEQRTGMPAYLVDDEEWYGAVDLARMELGIFSDNAPVCPHCGDQGPHADGRIQWISAHLDSRLHRWWWRYVRRV